MLTELREKVGYWLGAGKRRRARRDAAWRDVADRRDGTMKEGGTSIWKWEPPTIDAPVGEGLVHVDLHAVQVGNARTVLTRARADYVLGIGPQMKVYEAGWSGALGTMLGFEDVTLDDDAFDRDFVLRTADVEAARRAWTLRARGAASELLGRSLMLKTTHERVDLRLPTVAEDAATLDAMVTVVGDLAGYGWQWLEAMRAVPEARWIPAEGPWDDRTLPSAVVVVRGHEVRLHPVVLGPRLVVRASCRCARDLAPFELSVDAAGRPASEVPEGLLGATGARLLPELGGGTLSSDGEVVRVSVDIESPTGAMHHAAELAATVSLGDVRSGTFR